MLLHADLNRCSKPRVKTRENCFPGVACITARGNEAQHYIAIANSGKIEKCKDAPVHSPSERG